MDPQLAFFLGLLAVIVAAFVYFLRASFATIAAASATHARIYALAYVKGGALIALAMLASFEQSFGPLTNEAADALPWWAWAILYFKPIAAGLAVLVAFLDKTTANKEPPKP